MKMSFGFLLLLVLVALTLGCDNGGGTSLITGSATSKEKLPQAPAVPDPN